MLRFGCLHHCTTTLYAAPHVIMNTHFDSFGVARSVFVLSGFVIQIISTTALIKTYLNVSRVTVLLPATPLQLVVNT